jgi:hypothetical protein
VAGNRDIVVTHSSPLRTVSHEEVWPAVEEAGTRGPSEKVTIDTSELGDRTGMNWSAAHAILWQAANDLVAAANQHGGRILYFGMDHIPNLVALGAFIGDERRVELHDHHRDTGGWTWPATEPVIEVEELDLPSDVVRQPGGVVLRVEVSGAIADDDVRAVLSEAPSAEVRIRVKGTREVGVVRSAADVAAIRFAIRRALAVLREKRPEAETIHLFVFGPTSVAFSAGQELHLRSSPPVQTYQYRSSPDGPAYEPAIRLTSAAPATLEAELTDAERARAEHLRTVVFPKALASILNDTIARKELAPKRAPWYAQMLPKDEFDRVRPFPELIPLWEVISDRDRVSPEALPHSLPDYYGFTEKHREWRFRDSLLIGFDAATGGDDGKLEQLARLFFYHEYLHDWQNLTKDTAEDVGSFANCLERIDYMADAYAILHQLDHAIRTDRAGLKDPVAQMNFLREQIELAIRSFWAFDPAGEPRWQERRIRRYLNWYWRHVQVMNAPQWADLTRCFQLLSRPPAIEITGLEYQTDRRRIRLNLEKVRRGESLELGLVLEDGRFQRMASVGNVDIQALVRAFMVKDHDTIERIFRGIFDYARASGAVYPEA